MEQDKSLARKLFNSLNQDHDGTISFLELQQALRENEEFAALVDPKRRWALSAREVAIVSRELEKNMDADGDGEITEKEFEDWVFAAMHVLRSQSDAPARRPSKTALTSQQVWLEKLVQHDEANRSRRSTGDLSEAQATVQIMNGTPTDAVIVEVEAVIAPKGSVQPTVKKQEVAAPQDVQPTVPIGSLWQSILRDTVRSAIGLVAAEVWLFETDGSMRRVGGGYYVDPICEGGDEVLPADPGPARPGVGLAGLQMGNATSAQDARSAPTRTGFGAQRTRRATPPVPVENEMSATSMSPATWHVATGGGGRASLRSAGMAAMAVSRAGGATEAAPAAATLEWTLLQQLADDEDTPDDPRLADAAKVFGYITASGFSGGLLLLYSRRDTTVLQLNQPAQATFLAAQAEILGALAAAVPTRHAIMAKKGGSKHWRKLRLLLKTGMLGRAIKLQREREARGEVVAVKEERRECCPKTREWLINYMHKFGGVKGAAAPKVGALRNRKAWEVPAWTWLGITITLLVLSALNECITHLTDGEYFLMLGSFGALMALHFGAPNSPLAQPRNVIFSNLIAAGIAVVIYYLSGPEFLGIIPQWVAVAITPATAIAVNQRMGVLHPPAGAASLIFVSAGKRITDLGWMYLIMPLLVGNIICCIMASLINNISKMRQYPVFF